MKIQLSVFLIFLLAYCTVHGQKMEFPKEPINNWRKKNPELKPIKFSFFDTDLANQTYIFLSKWRLDGSLFAWDCEYRFVEFVKDKGHKVSIRNGENADKKYFGTKIELLDTLVAYVFIIEDLYTTPIKYWYRISKEKSGCGGNIVFPVLEMKPIPVLRSYKRDTLDIMGIVNMNREQKWFENLNGRISKSKLKTIDNIYIVGKSMDLNDDKIEDIFWYWEDLRVNEDDSELSYLRLYINVDGKWKIKWVYLYIECV